MRVRKGAKAFLPAEAARNPSILIDEISCAFFHIVDQIRKGNVGLLSDKKMSVVRHAMDCQELLPAMAHDSGDVFVQLLFVFRMDERLTAFYCEHDLDVDLAVGV